METRSSTPEQCGPSLAFYVTLESERGARMSDVVYADSFTAAGDKAAERHRGWEVLQVDRDPLRDRPAA